jgi:hypothetical protein
MEVQDRAAGTTATAAAQASGLVAAIAAAALSKCQAGKEARIRRVKRNKHTGNNTCDRIIRWRNSSASCRRRAWRPSEPWRRRVGTRPRHRHEPRRWPRAAARSCWRRRASARRRCRHGCRPSVAARRIEADSVKCRGWMACVWRVPACHSVPEEHHSLVGCRPPLASCASRSASARRRRRTAKTRSGGGCLAWRSACAASRCGRGGEGALLGVVGSREVRPGGEGWSPVLGRAKTSWNVCLGARLGAFPASPSLAAASRLAPPCAHPLHVVPIRHPCA